METLVVAGVIAVFTGPMDCCICWHAVELLELNRSSLALLGTNAEDAAVKLSDSLC